MIVVLFRFIFPFRCLVINFITCRWVIFVVVLIVCIIRIGSIIVVISATVSTSWATRMSASASGWWRWAFLVVVESSHTVNHV